MRRAARGEQGGRCGVRFLKSQASANVASPDEREATMLQDVTKLRRATARAIRNQPGIAALPRTMGVLLTAWLAYFFAMNLFAKQLDTVRVPYLDVPLSAYLAALGAFAVFGAAVYLLTRAMRAR